MNYRKKLLKKIEYLENPIDGYRILGLEDLIALVKSLPSEKEITKSMILKWAKGKVYQEEELKAINDCCKWLNKETV